MRHLKQSVLVFGCLFLIGAAHTASAAGFFIQDQSGKGEGDAFAGAAANPEDASILFYNAAGMADLSGPQISFGGSGIIPSSSFSNAGTKVAGVASGGNSGGDPFGLTPLPNLYLATPVRDTGLWAGLAVTAPFGLTDSYSSSWFGRYNSTETFLETIDIDPTLAYKVTPALSIGGGVDIQFADADLGNALPCLAALGCGPNDGTAVLKGHSWGLGFNAGTLWQVDPATNLGLSYRSGITQRLKGTTTIVGLTGALAGANGTFATSADLHLPDIVNFGVTHDVDPRLKLLGSFNWYNWDKFSNITADISNGAPPQVTPEDYRNTVSLAVGGEWKQTENLTFRSGFQFDETPTTSDRDTRVPDSNRYWLSVGSSYAFSKMVSVDVAYSHIFMPSASVDVTQTFFGGTPAATPVTTEGSSTNHVDIVALQTVLKF